MDGFSFSMLLACMIVAQDFGVSEVDVQKEFTFNRGTHLRMSWLWQTYDELVVARSYEVVEREWRSKTQRNLNFLL